MVGWLGWCGVERAFSKGKNCHKFVECGGGCVACGVGRGEVREVVAVRCAGWVGWRDGEVGCAKFEWLVAAPNAKNATCSRGAVGRVGGVHRNAPNAKNAALPLHAQQHAWCISSGGGGGRRVDFLCALGGRTRQGPKRRAQVRSTIPPPWSGELRGRASAKLPPR